MIEPGDRVRIKSGSYYGSVGTAKQVFADYSATVKLDVFKTELPFDDSQMILIGREKTEDSDNYPEGTIAITGHPANGQSVTRQYDGRWTFNVGDGRGETIDVDEVFRGAYKIIHIPGR